MDPDPPDPLPLAITPSAAHAARVHLGVTLFLLLLTLPPLLTRLYIRLRPTPHFFSHDDSLILLGFLSALTNWGLLQPSMFLTPRLLSYSESTTALKYAYLSLFFWGLSMLATKASIALTLLRIPLEHRAWKPSLYALVVLQGGYFVADTVYLFVGKCRPLSAAWDLVERQRGAECVGVDTDVLVSSIGSGVNVVTSLLLSVAPMLVLAKLRRPRRERVLVCVLTGMGLFASGTSVAKAVKVGRWGRAAEGEEWELGVEVATWTVVEMFVAVLAACSPSLKGPIENLLGRCGILLLDATGTRRGEEAPRVGFVDGVRLRVERRRGTREREGEREREVEVGMNALGRSGPVVFREGEDLEGKGEGSYTARRERRRARRERRRGREGGRAREEGESAGRVGEESRTYGGSKDAVVSGGNVHVIPE